MKKRLLFLLILFLLPLSTHYVFSHEGEEDFELDHSGIYPITQLEAVGYGSLVFVILIIVILLFHKKMNEITSALTNSEQIGGAPKKESPVTREFIVLNQNCEFLFSEISSLEKQLSPVLHHRPENAQSEDKDKISPISPLCTPSGLTKTTDLSIILYYTLSPKTYPLQM